MQFSKLLSVAAVLAATASAAVVPGTTGKLGDAAVVTDNPVGKTFQASFSGKVDGFVKLTTGAGGKGVQVSVDLSGFAGETGPFGYHIHDQPVPADGNCTGTKAHLDPFIRGQVPDCDNQHPATCEVGDLSGKHGKIALTNGTHFTASYTDDFISAHEGVGAYFGNRSIVIHRPDEAKTRLVCVNITEVTATSTSSSTGSSASSGNSTANNGTGVTTPQPPVSTGGAASYGVSGALAVAGVIAGLAAAL